MKDETLPDKHERLIALLGLASQEPQQAEGCPPEEQLALFVDGKLTGAAHEAMLAHLNHCSSCYHHWLEVAAYLNVPEPAAPKTSGAWSLSRLWPYVEPLFIPWRVAIPIAAVAAFAGLVVFRPAGPDLNQQLSAEYSAVLAQDPGGLAHRLPKLPLPGDRSALGFSEAQPTLPTQAFGAGLWVGRHALLGADEPPPAFLSAPAAAAWPESKWADYHALGRWTVLAWALAQGKPSAQDWRQPESILQALLANLSQRAPHEEEAKRAVAALQRLQPLLAPLHGQANEQARAELSRGLEITMQQLAP